MTLYKRRFSSVVHWARRGQSGWMLLFGLVAFSACGRLARLETEVANLSKEMSRLRVQHDDDLKDQLDRIISGEAQLWGRLECTNREVADFISDCEKGDTVGCSQETVVSAMTFMSTQPYATLYFRPDDPVEDLVQLRRGQISVLTDPQRLHPSTKFLILVQPQSESREHTKNAHRIGYSLGRMLREKFGVFKTVRIIGPRVLPCKLKQEQARSFMRRWDFPTGTEPTDKEPRIRVWVFRTDC